MTLPIQKGDFTLSIFQNACSSFLSTLWIQSLLLGDGLGTLQTFQLKCPKAYSLQVPIHRRYTLVLTAFSSPVWSLKAVDFPLVPQRQQPVAGIKGAWSHEGQSFRISKGVIASQGATQDLLPCSCRAEMWVSEVGYYAVVVVFFTKGINPTCTYITMIFEFALQAEILRVYNFSWAPVMRCIRAAWRTSSSVGLLETYGVWQTYTLFIDKDRALQRWNSLKQSKKQFWNALKSRYRSSNYNKFSFSPLPLSSWNRNMGPFLT